jgi:hypothetical protein
MRTLLLVLAATAVATLVPIHAQRAGDPAAGAVAWLDHLKTCTPYTYRYPNPIVPSVTDENIITGRKDGTCQVTYVIPGPDNNVCQLTAPTIALMTSADQYQQARTGRFGGSSSDALSQRMTQECTLVKKP